MQRKILKLAYENRGREISFRGFSEFGDVRNHEVLERIYGFRRHYPYREIRFKPTAKLKAASVSVCRSFNRLASRGLVRRVLCHGVFLTREGARLAADL